MKRQRGEEHDVGAGLERDGGDVERQERHGEIGHRRPALAELRVEDRPQHAGGDAHVRGCSIQLVDHDLQLGDALETGDLALGLGTRILAARRERCCRENRVKNHRPACHRPSDSGPGRHPGTANRRASRPQE